jgi:subtilisin family serine protease
VSTRSLLAITAVTALAAAALVASPAAATAAPGPAGPTSFEPGRYIVTLADPAVATYDGGIGGYPATTPDEGDQLDARRAPVQNYSDLLESRQADVAAAVGATIDVSYTMALNGFSAELTAAQAAELSADRAVASVTPDELLHPTAAVSSPSFLGLEGPGGVWESVGGAENAGRGVVVGVLDTGIAPENPSFAGSPLGTSPGAEPYLAGDVITFLKSDGDTFSGYCETGEQFAVTDCSTKIVGARYYSAGFGENRLGDASIGEYVSPRDGEGHGSHTASTAAGNGGVAAEVLGRDFGAISGVAPAAKVAAYKVCWSGPDPLATTDDGCSTTDILAAINQSVKDSVDVLNFSIGGAAAQTTYSLTGAAFLGAASAGIFVAASAGNSGPGASTLDNAAPWITTVAASTIPSYYSTVALGDGQSVVGGSISVTEPVSGSLVASTAVAADGAEPDQAALCYPGTIDAARLPANAIVVCDRGVVDRTAKSAEVKRAGGIGMVLTNATPSSLDVDAHAVPTVHVDAMFRDRVLAYAATPGATATLSPGNSTGYEPPTPQVAGFSSRGPVLADGSDILKPDITAPGVAILAAGANAAGAAPGFEFLSGTSMASPHIAGLAALYLGRHPLATPAEIKSAMMTTAYDTVDVDGATVTDPFVQGAGQVAPAKFFEPGLLYLNARPDWLAYLAGIGFDTGVPALDPSNLNLASIAVGTLAAPETITREVTSTQAGDFTASIEGLAGISATVKPQVLSFAAAGEKQSFTVTLARTDARLDGYATGSLVWSSGSTLVRSPIAVRPATLVVPPDVTGTGTTGSATVTVTPGGDGEIPLSTTGLSRATLLADPAGLGAGHSGEGAVNTRLSYRTTVAAGAAYARFALDGADDTADLDLTVYRLDAAGARIAGWQSASPAADEVIDLETPQAGDYEVLVAVLAAHPSTTWDLTATSVLPGGAPLLLDPPVLAGVQGVDVSYSASWAGLEPASTYVGLVVYGTTGLVTAVQVDTGAAPPGPVAPVNVSPPTVTGAAKAGATLTAGTGEWNRDGLAFSYQWLADSVPIAGATASAYVVTTGNEGAVITVVVTASVDGLPPASAASSGVAILYASTTALALNRSVSSTSQGVVATITVASRSSAPPTGTVTVAVNGKSFAVPITAADRGVVTFALPRIPRGIWGVTASYSGDATRIGSQSSAAAIWILM